MKNKVYLNKVCRVILAELLAARNYTLPFGLVPEVIPPDGHVFARHTHIAKSRLAN